MENNVSKIIPFSELTRQHKLQLLEHKRREFREREEYLTRLRKLFFQVEAQMRQAELEQFDLYQQIMDEFQLEVRFPSLGDRVGLQRLFTEDPSLVALTEFLEERLDPEECYNRLQKILGEKKKG
jgi:hypothetical protein